MTEQEKVKVIKDVQHREANRILDWLNVIIHDYELHSLSTFEKTDVIIGIITRVVATTAYSVTNTSANTQEDFIKDICDSAVNSLVYKENFEVSNLQ